MAAEHEISAEQWEARLAEAHPPRKLMDNQIMNYLIFTGEKEAALKFEKESGIKATFDDKIDDRRKITDFVVKGQIAEAIAEINRINSEILETDKDLNFDLLKQQMIELIKQKRVMEAIQFAQEKLSPLCASGDARATRYQEEVDKTMTLLMYTEKGFADSPQRQLTEQASLNRLKDRVNKAILVKQGLPGLLILEFYLKLQKFIEGRVVGIPKLCIN